MEFEQFREAVDSLIDFPQMVGIMGGEPLLHPEFERFCDYALTKIGWNRLGLWSSFPPGKERHREVICRTFRHLFLNDHSRPDIYHCPILVGAEEVITKPGVMWALIDHCWVQNNWSAAINPKGAFFCEVAAAMSLLFEGSPGWKVEPGWWWRTPKDFGPQMEEYCVKCGCAMPLRRRASVDGRDDISPLNFERLKGRSKKLEAGQCIINDCKVVPQGELGVMAAYKDMHYRSRIAARYGIFLIPNDFGFLTPHLLANPRPLKERPKIIDFGKALDEPKLRQVGRFDLPILK